VDYVATPVGAKLPGCTPAPAQCPATTFAHLPAGAAVVYVSSAGGNDSFDGTADKPMRTILAALAVAKAGGYVALAAGEYNEALIVKSSISLVGVCAAKVSVVAPGATPCLAVGENSKPMNLVVSGVTFKGDGPGIWAGAQRWQVLRSDIRQLSYK